MKEVLRERKRGRVTTSMRQGSVQRPSETLDRDGCYAAAKQNSRGFPGGGSVMIPLRVEMSSMHLLQLKQKKKVSNQN